MNNHDYQRELTLVKLELSTLREKHSIEMAEAYTKAGITEEEHLAWEKQVLADAAEEALAYQRSGLS